MTMTKDELNSALKNYTGAEVCFRHELYKLFTYTEGVQFLAAEAGAYWLVELIFGLQHTVPAVKAEPFQCWKLETSDYAGKLTCEDGNGNKVYTRAIEFTDFPMEEITLWFTDSVLLLPSEY